MRPASMVSSGTPLMAADRSTIEKPTWAQIMITMSSRLLTWAWLSCSHATGSIPNLARTALSRPICGVPAGRAS